MLRQHDKTLLIHLNKLFVLLRLQKGRHGLSQENLLLFECFGGLLGLGGEALFGHGGEDRFCTVEHYLVAVLMGHLYRSQQTLDQLQ